MQAQTNNLKATVPLGGNSWLMHSPANHTEKLTDKGWQQWTSPDAVWSTYVYISQPGNLKLSLRAAVPTGESKVRVTLHDQSKTARLKGSSMQVQTVGEWQIDQPGYIEISTQGISKSGEVFANVSDVILEGSAVTDSTSYVKNNEGNYFYWGRRGPSVHLRYDLSAVEEDVDTYYSEITVPEGNDVIGSYYMANGFGEGYFGMQVNSATERRVLFSVWSPYTTDNPDSIPEDQKIILLEKGSAVHAGEFGNEGSGGQSYLQYNWKAGTSYRFLLKAKPVANNHTEYSAWFYAPETKSWMLIARFSRPATHTYLKSFYSFLENFDPEMGTITRKALYHNQWVKTVSGKWIPVQGAMFSYDATAKKQYRLDYQGGVENGGFYLKNCGFFNEHTEYGKQLKLRTPPDIDF